MDGWMDGWMSLDITEHWGVCVYGTCGTNYPAINCSPSANWVDLIKWKSNVSLILSTLYQGINNIKHHLNCKIIDSVFSYLTANPLRPMTTCMCNICHHWFKKWFVIFRRQTIFLSIFLASTVNREHCESNECHYQKLLAAIWCPVISVIHELEKADDNCFFCKKKFQKWMQHRKMLHNCLLDIVIRAILKKLEQISFLNFWLLKAWPCKICCFNAKSGNAIVKGQGQRGQIIVF